MASSSFGELSGGRFPSVPRAIDWPQEAQPLWTAVTCHRFRPWRLADGALAVQRQDPSQLNVEPTQAYPAPAPTSRLRRKAVTSHRTPKRFALATWSLATTLITFLLLSLTPSLQAQSPTLRFGGEIPPEVDRMYERGLGWLAQKQSQDGQWQDGQSGAGQTGLCLMAFLASGEDPNYGKYASTVRRAVRSLIMSQDPITGYFPTSMYHHGFAMLAMAEAYGSVDESQIWDNSTPQAQRRPIAKVLDAAIRCAVSSSAKNPFGAWRYSPEATDADTSVAGAVLMGLLACRNAGLTVPDDTVNKGVEYIRKSTAKNGYVNYSGGFGGGGESMARSSVATLVYAIAKHKDWEEFTATLKHISVDLEHREGSHPEYYRYYAAQALFQGDYEAWQKWNRNTIRSFKETQTADGAFGSSSYQTAMSLLALALNYRFLPIYER